MIFSSLLKGPFLQLLIEIVVGDNNMFLRLWKFIRALEYQHDYSVLWMNKFTIASLYLVSRIEYFDPETLITLFSTKVKESRSQGLFRT